MAFLNSCKREGEMARSSSNREEGRGDDEGLNDGLSSRGLNSSSEVEGVNGMPSV